MTGHKLIFRRETANTPGLLAYWQARRLVRQAVYAALEGEGVAVPCEVSVLFTDDAGIRVINREHRDIDSATDVLSFPLNELTPGAFDPSAAERGEHGRVLLGDIVLSLEHARAQGEEFGHGYARELRYLTVHSVLHLLGYDHLDEGEQKRQMRSREKQIMARLGVQETEA